MREAFLHFIWQYQYFNKPGLITSDGAPVNILHPGTFNTDAGPDFMEAKIIIGDMEWRGHVELHVKSSDWNTHRHTEDAAYNNVILHVVWSHNQEVKHLDNTIIPTLEIQKLVPEKLIFGYKKLFNSPYEIPCEKQWHHLPDITWVSTLDKVLMERLSSKASAVLGLLQDNAGDWEETAYQLLAKNFGFKVNSEPFLLLAQSVPYKILKKHRNDIRQIESLLFGQAGLLENDVTDAHKTFLVTEYDFLRHKYELSEGLMRLQWKFLRLRPANFPTVRLAQFSQVVHSLPSLFNNLLEVASMQGLKKLLRVSLSQYWTRHYDFGKQAKKDTPALGAASIENIAINTIAPLLVAYGQHVDDTRYIDKAIELLQELKPEKNRITDYWTSLGAPASSAFDSQAQIQLYNEYCKKRRCLSCNVGVRLIREN